MQDVIIKSEYLYIKKKKMSEFCTWYLTSRSSNKIKATKREKLHLVKRFYDSNTTHEVAVKYFVLFRHDTIVLFEKKNQLNKEKTHKQKPNYKENLNKQLPQADRTLCLNLLKIFIIHDVLYLFSSLSWKGYSKVQSATTLHFRVSQVGAVTWAV